MAAIANYGAEPLLCPLEEAFSLCEAGPLPLHSVSAALGSTVTCPCWGSDDKMLLLPLMDP